ncbi:hypothetical protein [Haloferula sp. BvORR071]|uniref:hypothetical protein n=1 Tax=Haloferula sp. BvORR071 TaxID=1396141 RepID=UPI00054E01D8|nr:hypothetical protein [Haloferula sp. BvORR071]
MPALYQRPPLNANQKALLAIAVLFWLLAATVFTLVITSPDGHLSNALAGAVCPGIFAAIFSIIVQRQLRPRGHKTMPNLVRSTGRASGKNYGDVEIRAGQALPKICIRCGEPTRRTSPFRFKGAHTDANPYDWSRVNPVMFFFLAWRFAFQLLVVKLYQSIERRIKRRQAEADGVEFKIPHCRSCAKNSPVVQRHFDFHGRKMVLEAHSQFREALKGVT